MTAPKGLLPLNAVTQAAGRALSAPLYRREATFDAAGRPTGSRVETAVPGWVVLGGLLLGLASVQRGARTGVLAPADTWEVQAVGPDGKVAYKAQETYVRKLRQGHESEGFPGPGEGTAPTAAFVARVLAQAPPGSFARQRFVRGTWRVRMAGGIQPYGPLAAIR